jgi:pimeloyl-ACP methyl ester carboxylesterase
VEGSAKTRCWPWESIGILPNDVPLDLSEPDRARFLEGGRTRIRLWEWGDPSARPVVMVHGGWDHGRMFDGLAPVVARMDRHVVAVDLRGHGDSGGLGWSGVCWLAWNLDLGRLLRSFAHPAGLVGHSLGGGQVLSVAALFPELVEWVVSIDGLGPPSEVLEGQFGCADWLDGAETAWGRPVREYQSVEEMAARRRSINVRMPQDWALHLARHGSRPGPSGGLVWKSDPVNRVGGPGPFCEESLLIQYGHVRCPVSVLTGSEVDTWSDLPPDAIDRRMAVIAGGRHRTIAGAGHYIHLERADEVLADIEAMVAT